MKNLYLILISVITLNACAQKEPINLVDSVLNNLKINKTECWSEFIIEQSISKSESIVFIPKIKKDEEGMTLDAYLLIVNNKTGKIESRFTKKECWYSDAVRLENIKIIYQPYNISEKSETIGILISYYGSSKVNPYSSKELSIFERKGEFLKRVLEDFPTYTLNGENDGNSNGKYVEHKITIKPEVNSKTEFYNLKVVDSIIKTEYKEGIEKIIKKSEKTEKLEYTNGIYKNVL
jgi:hypothetical protein